MAETILLVGFDPTGADDPAARALARLAGEERSGFAIQTLGLPRAWPAARERLEQVAPAEVAAVLVCDLHPESEVWLGLVAKNQGPEGEPLDPGGPAQAVAALPVGALKLALDRAGAPCQLSEDAGSSLGGAVFYWAATRLGPAALLGVPADPARAPEVELGLSCAVELVAQRLAARRVEASA